MKHLFFFQDGSFLPIQPQQYQVDPFGAPLDTYYGAKQAPVQPNPLALPNAGLDQTALQGNPPVAGLNDSGSWGQWAHNNPMYLSTLPESPKYAPGTYQGHDIDNNGIPDLVQSPTGTSPQSTAQTKDGNGINQKPDSQQKNSNYEQLLYALYGHPYYGTQTFNQKLGQAIAFKPQDDPNAPFGLRGQNVLRGVQIAGSALGSLLGNTREIFGAFAAQKRQNYFMQKDAENRRDSMLSNPYGQSELFNNGYQQIGNLMFSENGGQVGDVLDLDEATIKKLEREGYVFERI